jgi:hypothetical protein
MFWTQKTAYVTVALLHFWLTAVPLCAFTSPALHRCNRHYTQHSWLTTTLFQYLYHGLQCSFCKKEKGQCPWCKINALKPIFAYFPFSKRKLQMLHTIVYHKGGGPLVTSVKTWSPDPIVLGNLKSPELYNNPGIIWKFN